MGSHQLGGWSAALTTAGIKKLSRACGTDLAGAPRAAVLQGQPGGAVETSRLVPDAVRQILLKRAAKAGLKGTLAEPVSPHGLRAGFVTTAYGNGVPDEEIMGHTRHRSLTTMRSYVRRAKLSRNSPAGKLGL